MIRHGLHVLLLCLPALPGCEMLSLTEGPGESAPTVVVSPSPHVPGLGLVRTGESFTGTTSWYSVRTNGGTRTASGEKLSDHEDTAAHRSLPFGTLIEVTNLANDRTVILRVNDRGPFTKGRVLDVSIGAAKKLDFHKNGITTCRVDVLQASETPPNGAVTSETESGE